MDSFEGLSKHQVLKCVRTNEKLQKYNIKFVDKAKTRPVNTQATPNRGYERHGCRVQWCDISVHLFTT